MKPIVVVGISHHNTLGVIRALGRKGLSRQLHLILIGVSDNISCSRYISNKRLFRIPSEATLVETLDASLIGTSGNPAIVICCSDSSIAVLDASRSLLKDRYILPSASFVYGGIQGLMGKDIQATIATEVGIHIPDSTLLNVKEKSFNLSLEKWDCYPCILKPIDSIQGHKTDIHICPDKASLISDIKSSACTKFIVQKYIDKDFEFQLIGCSLKGGEDVVLPGYTRIIRQPDNTNTGFLQYSPIGDQMRDALSGARSFLKKIGYSGLFSIEFLRGKDGVDYFMEINMRNDGNAICVTDAGMNLPYIWCAYNSGEDYSSEVTNGVKSLYCMPEFDDFVFVLKGKLSLGTWLKDVRKTQSFMEYSKDDKRPFYKKMRLFVGFLFKKLFKRY
ncbi:MAG: ATP-grasp domain-containing protein [Bacteroidales bacterium]|nr:ATP-grasp domain-containing protein [Bacteroidales bacterium]